MVKLHPTTHLPAAAWVPDDDPHRPWDEAADLAANWIWERSDIEEATPLLVTNTLKNAVGITCLEEIAREGGLAPRKASNDSTAAQSWHTCRTSDR